MVALTEAGYSIVVLDNLLNSDEKVGERINLISGQNPKFYKVDLLDKDLVKRVFELEKPNSVIHFAAHKSVSDSVSAPIDYYQNNVTGTLNLLNSMDHINCNELIFSSSAAVYGNPEKLPITEKCEVNPASPYGRTKVLCETIISDWVKSPMNNACISLRYFNPIGAHVSGLIGDNSTSVPNNIMPYLVGVALGKYPELLVYGNDYNTLDGTGVRDYIHVMDISRAHVLALQNLEPGHHMVLNLGTGTGYSVLELVNAFEAVIKNKLPVKIINRRKGDVAEIFADPSLAHKALGWRARHDLVDMCRTAWDFGMKLQNSR